MRKYISTFLVAIILLMSTSACNETSVKENLEKDNGVVVDLTSMSATLAYAEVFRILSYPGEYIGKTIKISGPYVTSFSDETGSYYHFVVIDDVTACCQQSLEFIWKGEHIFPDDYPKKNAVIEITGIFDTYKELGELYCYLSVEDIVFMQ